MYLHCCHLLPLCRWCYCCGSLLLMFISYKCHTQSADIAGPQYQLSVVAQSTDNRLVNDPPTTFVLFFVQHTRLWWIYFAQLVILLNFFQLHKSHREYDSFFMKYFLSAKSSQAVIWEWTVWQVGWVGWLAIWHQIMLPLWGTGCP